MTAVAGFLIASCGGLEFKAVYAGPLDTCAIRCDDSLVCWGYNLASNLGEGSTAQYSAVPVRVEGIAGPISAVVASASQTCVLLSSGGVQCWGETQLAQGSVAAVARATTLEGLPSVVGLAVGDYGKCALGRDTRLWCLGGAEVLGTGGDAASSVPGIVTTLDAGVIQVVSGSDHMCALTSAAAVSCWGNDMLAQVGDRIQSKDLRRLPVAVAGLPANVSSMVAGAWHTCALTANAQLWCWGGVAGDELDAGVQLQPTLVAGLPLVSLVAAGGYYTCVLTKPGDVMCWGNRTGATPTKIQGLPGSVKQLAVGNSYGCALIEGGDIWCWGFNLWGQLGNGGITDSWTPVRVGG